MKLQGPMTEEQEKVLQLRCKKQYSFAAIAAELNLFPKGSPCIIYGGL
ncbi:hypothetical protein [Autumnicola musiva]|uniref:Transposase IS30-like HTH domain-containing protein n=1 Tax=Autumnicola musiva TaxID=3075589 RepID=A0ABU3DBD6_9FLAO|nr:hypothetical protein [Zunongwangia sp. F117]MDT0678842.1 hypothetical protein [Zunongwangia sp. F117]